jgi:hypothetical protein
VTDQDEFKRIEAEAARLTERRLGPRPKTNIIPVSLLTAVTAYVVLLIFSVVTDTYEKSCPHLRIGDRCSDLLGASKPRSKMDSHSDGKRELCSSDREGEGEMTAADTWAAIYPWIVAGLGGFIGAALLLPTKLDEALFSYRLGKALEGFKAEQNRELERLKEQLTHVGDRGKRSNEMEFSSIKLVWDAFIKAWLSTNTCAAMSMTVPRFERMSEEEVKSFAVSSKLSEVSQKTLLAATDRTKEYVNIVSWRLVIEAEADIFQARLILREQRIFMPAELTQQFSEVIEQMSGAQVERRLTLENPHIRANEFGDAATQWVRTCTATFERLAASANARLFRQERQHEQI